MSLVVVTATTDLERARACLASWGNVQVIIVANGKRKAVQPEGQNLVLQETDYLGSVPAFRKGVDFALEHTSADVICAFHDDLEIRDPLWLQTVERHFRTHPACGLAGFGGAIGLGAENLYKVAYDPMLLARVGFRSNLVNAETHGIRSLLAEQVAVLDAFSMIGRREFYAGKSLKGEQYEAPWTYMVDNAFYHHFQDGAAACLAARYGWHVWYLPVACTHYGGRTAVADAGYQEWAKQQIPEGDQGFWLQSHKHGYQLFHDVLPIRL